MKNWIKAIAITSVIAIAIAASIYFDILPWLFVVSIVLVGVFACVCIIKEILDECDRERRK